MEVGVVWPRRSDVRAALWPLWEDGALDTLQLTVEHAFAGELDAGFTGPLDRAAAEGRLVGHAVLASPFTSPRDGIHHDWLRRTRAVLARWPVRWLTDHFGCCRGGGWQAAPLPVPPSPALVAGVRDHLAWVRDELQVQVGLENLALAFSRDDVLVQPDLVDAMVRPVGGLVLLDLHNLWCQAVNFDLDPIALIERWPLDLVREIHVGGGRWETYPEGRFRRDTHDGPVPDEVFALVPEAIARCPRAEVVTWERLRGTVDDPDALRAEVGRLRQVVGLPATATAGTLPPPPPWRSDGVEAVQEALFTGLRTGDLAPLHRAAPGWAVDGRALRVAADITARWGRPAPRP